MSFDLGDYSPLILVDLSLDFFYTQRKQGKSKKAMSEKRDDHES